MVIFWIALGVLALGCVVVAIVMPSHRGVDPTKGDRARSEASLHHLNQTFHNGGSM